jgi:hypothetical protein
MLTLRQVISDIKSGFKWIDSNSLASDRFIASELMKESIMLIKQQTDKRKLLSSENIFTAIPCLEMEEVPLSECCSFNSFPCTIGRSKYKLPKISEGIYGLLIQGVYDIKGKLRFDYMDPDRYSNYLALYGDRATKNRVFWKQDGYLYVNNPDIKLLKVLAFFEETVPQWLLSCSDDDVTCPVNPLDAEFKCPGFLVSPVKDKVRKTLEETFKRSVQNLADNDVDTTK